MALTTSLTTDELSAYLARQLSTFFPDRDVAAGELRAAVAGALERVEHCFSRVRRRGYWAEGHATFDHLYTDQYAAFLWFVGNTLHKTGGDRRLATKTYALNKALHALDVYFEVSMPEVFCFQHPVGTVIGRATLANYLFVYQGVNLGGSVDLDYPTLGEGVVLFNGAAVTGKTVVGANVWVGPQANVKEGAVPPSSVVFGAGPGMVIKPTTRDVRKHFFEALPA